MYGSFPALTEPSVISSALANADRTSRASAASAAGCVSSRYVAPESVVAVVSDPASTRMKAFEPSFSNERFCR